MLKYDSFWIVFFGCTCFLMGCSSDDGTEEPTPEPLSNFALQSPNDQSINISSSPTLQWDSAGNSARYHLTLSLNENLSQPIYDVTDISQNSYVLPEPLLFGGTYYWTVTATMDASTVEVKAEETFSFRTVFGKIPPSPEISKYYVATDGVDNVDRGTADQPFKTVAYGSRMLPELEGDTLFIKNGSYEETTPIILPLHTNLIGESTSGVVIKSDGVELPEDFEFEEKIEDQYQYALVQMASVEVQDGNHELAYFTLDGGQKQLEAGIWAANRNSINMHHIQVHDVNYRGVSVGTTEKLWFRPPETYITGIHLHHLDFENSGKDLEEYSTGNLNIGQLEGAEIHDITVKDNEGYGIKFLWDGYFKESHFYNITTELSESDPLWGEDIGLELWNLGPGNVVENISSNTWLSLVNHPYVFANQGNSLNLILENARVVDASGTSSKEGLEIGLPHVEISNCYIENKAIGLALWNMGHNHVNIHHNLFRNDSPISSWAGGTAIYIDNSRDWSFEDIHLYHNVFDSFVYGIRVRGDNIEDIAIKNNLFLGTSTAELDIEDGSITFAHNFRHTLASDTWNVFGAHESYNNGNGDAMINASGDWLESFYLPLAHSPLIDTGEDIGFSFRGVAPDIGFLEY